LEETLTFEESELLKMKIIEWFNSWEIFYY
jgi:hypothetical protein